MAELMAAPMSASTAAVAETTGSLFPEPVEAIETPVEDEMETESHPQKAVISEGTNRAEWVEHVAHMENSPAATRSGGGDPKIQQLPPDADTVGWASDAVGWVTEIAERRSNLPEEIPVEEMLMPGLEQTNRARIGKSRHTIELVLAVVLLTWALVFLGYRMGTTGPSRTTHRQHVTVAKATAATASKGDLGKSDVASGAGGNSGMSAERSISPEAGIEVVWQRPVCFCVRRSARKWGCRVESPTQLRNRRPRSGRQGSWLLPAPPRRCRLVRRIPG